MTRRAASAAADVAKRDADIAKRDAVACGLFADAIDKFGTQQLKAGGSSMRPAIWPGDRLVIQATDPSHVAIGDVVAFRRRSAIVAHRVVATLDLAPDIHLVTRGDRLHEEDAPTAPHALLGRVVSIRRGPFRIDPARPVTFGWRAASALLETALVCRLRLSSAWYRARAVVSLESGWAN